MIHRQLGVPVTWDKDKKRKTPPVKKNQPPRKLGGAVEAGGKAAAERPLTWDIELSGASASEKQNRRAKRRQAAKALQPHNTLRRASVSTVTRNRYDAHWMEFVRWTRKAVTIRTPLPLLDRRLTDYLEHLYLQGEDLSRANYITAAAIYQVPGLKGLASLPMTQQSMKGWRRLCPPRSRMPIPYEVTCLLALTACQQGLFEVALAMLLIFALYLRPNEAFLLRNRDIVRPVKSKPKAFKHFAVVLHPMEEGIPSKTLQWDEMLSLDLEYQKFLGPALIQRLQLDKKSLDEPAFTISAEDVNNFMQEQWQELGLNPLGQPHLYRLRHGGASHEAAHGLRELTAIQARGRWQTLKSVKNYEKGGRLQQLFGALSASTRKASLQAVQQVQKHLHCRR